jgi:hypothetical protein
MFKMKRRFFSGYVPVTICDESYKDDAKGQLPKELPLQHQLLFCAPSLQVGRIEAVVAGTVADHRPSGYVVELTI